MISAEPELLVHLRGQGEARFVMPPAVARATPLGLSLPASRLFGEVDHQMRRAAIIVGPAGCGKSYWLAEFAQRLDRRWPPARMLSASHWPAGGFQAEPATLMIDDIDLLAESARHELREQLQCWLQQSDQHRAVVVTRLDHLAAQFDPHDWLELQWSPIDSEGLAQRLADWDASERAHFLQLSRHPVLALLRQRVAILEHWPREEPPADLDQVQQWLMAHAEQPDWARIVAEFKALLDAWRQPAQALAWQAIPSGQFVMGSPDNEAGRWDDEGPQHPVQIDGFSCTTTPLTNAHYLAMLDEGMDTPPWWGDARFARPNQPVVGLRAEAMADIAGRYQAQLPTEAQWEYLCRAGSADARPTNALEQQIRYDQNCVGLPEIASRQPNAFELYDTLGTVWERTQDSPHPSFLGAPGDGAAWLDSASKHRVLRGGSWADSERVVRSATRLSGHPGPRIANTGLRLVRT